MKKNIFLKGLIALLFSVNLGAMYNPGKLYVRDPEKEDYSWTLFEPVEKKLDFLLGLDIEVINGGSLSLFILNDNYATFQKHERSEDGKSFKYGIPGLTVSKDFYSNLKYIEKLSCPLVASPEFKVGDVVARINDDEELWHLDCLVNILRQNPFYKDAKSLYIYFLFK